MTVTELRFWLAFALFLCMLVSVPYGFISGDAAPAALCLLGLAGLSRKVIEDCEIEWDKHDAIEKARRG